MHTDNETICLPRRRIRWQLSWLCAALLASGLVAGSFVPTAWSKPFEEWDLFFECNLTDEDCGIHAMVDGDGWENIVISTPSPGSDVIFDLVLQGSLLLQTLTEFSFESAEPEFADQPPAALFAMFPEGQYEITGTGETTLKSKAMLTHLIPDEPENVMVNGIPAAEDCDAELPSVSPPVTITWDPVTMSHPGEEFGVPVKQINRIAHLVVFEVEATSSEVSFSLPPDVTEVEAPGEILNGAAEVKFEILTKEASGNQSAIESCFEVE